MATKGLVILGATGSIGSHTLDVVKRHPDRYRVVALTANRNVDAMVKLCTQWRPPVAVMVNEQAADRLQQRLAKTAPEVKVGFGEAIVAAATHPETDYVMAAIVGAAGLLPTLAAAQAGKRVLLANKEALVMSGRLFMDAVTKNGAQLLPIDSEHNAVFQCLPNQHGMNIDRLGVKRILLTGSGGPFRQRALKTMGDVTPTEACAHPNWIMGRKISVDSATMMNKGLELIEACWLFATQSEKIHVVVHPQSIVHSMVEYRDGSVLAQLSHPDMRVPIAHALAWPERMTSGVASLDFASIGRLDFEDPDLDRFPCLRLAIQVAMAGGNGATILNAANEVAVAAFLDGRLRFPEIAMVNETVVADLPAGEADNLDTILALDAKARGVAERAVAALQS